MPRLGTLDLTPEIINDFLNKEVIVASNVQRGRHKQMLFHYGDECFTIKVDGQIEKLIYRNDGQTRWAFYDMASRAYNEA